MRQSRRLGILAAAVLALTLVACDEDNGARVVGPDGTEIEVTAVPTDVPGEGSPTPAVTEAPANGTETPAGSPDATAPADATATATEGATSTPSSSGAGTGTGGGLEGSPFGTADVRAAIEEAGLTFQVDDERAPGCPGTTVPETTFEAGDDGGATSVWSLWVYPDSDAREADWELDDGQLVPQADDCALPSGFNYFNANAVLAFVGWDGPADGSAGDSAAREAFLEMGP